MITDFPTATAVRFGIMYVCVRVRVLVLASAGTFRCVRLQCIRTGYVERMTLTQLLSIRNRHRFGDFHSQKNLVNLFSPALGE